MAVRIIPGSVGAVLATRVTLISHLHLPGTMPIVTISGVIGLAIALLVMLLAAIDEPPFPSALNSGGEWSVRRRGRHSLIEKTQSTAVR